MTLASPAAARDKEKRILVPQQRLDNTNKRRKCSNAGNMSEEVQRSLNAQNGQDTRSELRGGSLRQLSEAGQIEDTLADSGLSWNGPRTGHGCSIRGRVAAAFGGRACWGSSGTRCRQLGPLLRAAEWGLRRRILRPCLVRYNIYSTPLPTLGNVLGRLRVRD